MARFLLILVLLVTAFVSAAPAEVRVSSGDRPPPSSFAAYRSDMIVVQFAPEILAQMNRETLGQGRLGLAALDRLAEQFGITSIRAQFPGAVRRLHAGRVIDLTGWHKIRFQGEIDVHAAVAAFKAAAGVLEAQLIGIHAVCAAPNDEYYVNQWHLPKIGAPQAWDQETGKSPITVAIIDTGVRYFHKDLGGSNASYADPSPANIGGNIWTNDAEKSGLTGVDDDGNGKVDDWVGWDCVEAAYFPKFPYRLNPVTGEDNTVADNDPRDFNGHGTHCAGIVAAITNNGGAVAGVAGGWVAGGLPVPAGNGVRIMPLRIGWSARSVTTGEIGLVDMSYAAEAFYYASQKGARIASCSWGSSNTGGLAAALDYFVAGGGLIFVAAGNDGKDRKDYMCNRPDIIKVAATDQNDLKASWSNFGAWVDLCAPGVGIWSLVHNHNDPANDYLASMSGTSMATPMVAGVAALIWSQNQTWTAAQVKTQLLNTCDNIDALNPDYAGKLGRGRINAAAAVTTGPPLPTVGVEQMLTGRYKSKWLGGGFVATSTFNRGDKVVIRVLVTDAGTPVANATVALALTGPLSQPLTTGPTGSDGWAEAAFQTSKPSGSNPGTPIGAYTATVTGVTASGYDWNEVAETITFNLQ